jgi:RimJ/RimL family protein N-acetyltransferase
MSEMVQVRRLVPDDWRLWRDVRITALADAPYAFGSTLAREQAFDEATWRRWLSPANGMTAAAFLDGEPVGVIGGWTPDGTGTLMLVALWVAPAARGHGAGDALVAEVAGWATEHGYPAVELRVADGNHAARTLFLRNGFTPTGRREPLESDPTVGTEFLVRELS